MLMLLMSILQINILGIFSAQAKSVEDTRLTLSVEKVTLVEVFKEIEKKTNYRFSYNDAYLNENVRVTVKIHDKKLGDVLGYLSKEVNLQFKQVRGNIHVLNTNPATARSITTPKEILISEVVASGAVLHVSGKIVSREDNLPIAGATIHIKGTNKGTVADAAGNFKIDVDDNNAVLEISSIGFIKQEIRVAGKTTLLIELTPDVAKLDEVVVVGYGTQKVKDLTGSVGVVKVEDAKKTATYDVAKMLQGQVAGVTVHGSGEPGGFVSIKIRGISSFNNNSPLFVIDGVPVDAPFDFSPNDIESVQVLKDASAGAIYGSRAATGVVIITTKKGKAGPLKVDYTGYAGVQDIARRIPVTNRLGYQKITSAAELNAGLLVAPGNDPNSPQYISNVDTDWQKEGFKTGRITDHSLSLSGGSEAIRGNVSFGYFDQSSTYTGPQNYTRYTLNGNLSGKKGIFSFGAKFAYTQSHKVNNANTREHAVFGGSVTSLLTAIPTMPVYDPNRLGGYGGSDNNTQRAITLNVVGMNALLKSTSDRNRILGNAWAELEFVKDLKYRLSVSYDRTDWEDFFFEPKYDLGFYYLTPQAFLSRTRGGANTFLVENTLSYVKEFGKHKVDALVGATHQKDQWASMTGTVLGLTEPYFYTLSAGIEASGGRGVNEYQWNAALQSFLGRLNYNYDDKFLLTYNFRRDGSSRFSPANRYGNFMSLAGAVNVHNLIKLPEFINSLKVRGGYGELGNQSIGQYLYDTYINTNANYVFNNVLATGATRTQVVDPSIKWEAKKTTNVALDFGFLNDRVSFTAEYFDNRAYDMLVGIPIPASVGSTNATVVTNIGSVSNSGIEFTATYRQKTGDFKYEVSANAHTLKNKVLALGGNNEPIYGAASKTEVGHSVGEIYGYVTEGIFQNLDDVKNHATQLNAAPGDIKFKDLNADGKITADGDRTYLGSAIPNFYYGVNVGASYKNFDLSFFIQGQMGSKVYNGVYRDLMGQQYSNHHVDALNYWTPTNTNTNVPRPVIGDPNSNTRDSDRFIESGDYLRMQNAQIGYNVPSSILSKLKGISKVRIYASGQNVFLLSGYRGYDPDFASDGLLSRGYDYGSYPNPRTVLLGLQVSF